jgi:hypothetical protein
MKAWIRGFLVLLCIGLVVLGVFVSLYPQAIGYWRFSWRSKTYYIQIARACEELIAQAGSSQREIREEGVNSLPIVLRDLEPSYVIVDTNFVMLRIGGGQMSHSIVWGCVKSDRHVWRLRLAGPDHERSIVLYEETKAAE